MVMIEETPLVVGIQARRSTYKLRRLYVSMVLHVSIQIWLGRRCILSSVSVRGRGGKGPEPFSILHFDMMDELCSVGQIIRALQTCMKKKDLSYARQVYERIRNNGLETHQDVGNHIVPVFVECGSVSDAQEAFNRLIHRNVHSWTYLMRGYTQCGQSRHALNLYPKMQADSVQPNCHTFVALLKACACLKDVQQGQEIHVEAVKKGLEQDLFIGGTLVDTYAKWGSLWEAQDLLDRLVVRDVVSWNALIAGCAEHGESHNALDFFERMQFEDVPPNTATFACILKACGSLGAMNRGQELYKEIVQKGFERDLFVRTSLIDMHAKCGSLIDAHNVLDNLMVRNAVSWNALIAGYAEYGCGQEVLRCVDQMQQEGVVQDAVTHMCVLKACGNMEAMERGHETHTKIIQKGFETDVFIGSTLVDMYAKCGSLSEAWEVFRKLPFRNVVSWNVLITGYVEHGPCQAALKCFEQMQQEGVSPTALTYVCILKACGNTGTVDKGQNIHTQIAQKGLERDVTIGNTLVDMYGKCGVLSEAQVVFDNLPNRCVVSWNRLISGYAEHGPYHEAVNCFEQMQMEGIMQDAVTFACVLKAYGYLAMVAKGREMHSEIIQKGFEKDHLVFSMLVDMYAKCGSLGEAQDVFDKIPALNTVSWNALIAGYAEHGPIEEAWKGFKQMQLQGISPTLVTYICVLKACCSINDVRKGREINMAIIQKGCDGDPFVSSALVDMYAKCGLLVEAQECVDRLPLVHQYVVSWNALIAGYTEHGLNQEALNCFEQMQLKGVYQDAVTYAGVLRACSVLVALDRGQDVHIAITHNGFERDTFVGSTLVDMYVKCGSLAEAKKVFEDLPARNVVSWNALITGLSEHGLGQEALSCFEQMQQQSISPNAITFLCILKACGSKLGTVKKGWELHIDIVRKGFEVDPYVGSTLVDMYVKCGWLAEAYDIFNKLPLRNNVSWNAIIKGYGMNHEGDMAVEFFENMCAQGLKPDAITFTCLLTACSRASMIVKGQELFEVMREEYGIVPTVDHLTCMVDLLARSGQLDEAGKYLDSIPSFPSKDMWTTLLCACKTYQEGGLGVRCFEHLV